jgi:hypothetical protein
MGVHAHPKDDTHYFFIVGTFNSLIINKNNRVLLGISSCRHMCSKATLRALVLTSILTLERVSTINTLKLFTFHPTWGTV